MQVLTIGAMAAAAAVAASALALSRRKGAGKH